MIKAIETSYSGYRFRSRTEARWAIWLDAMNIKWDYEYEGYNLGEYGFYLPDFLIYLPYGDGTCEEDAIIKGYIKVLFEIKPNDENKINRVHEELSKESGIDLICIYGPPMYKKYSITYYTKYGLYEKSTTGDLVFATGRRDKRELAIVSNYECVTLNALNDSYRHALDNSDLIINAYTKACSARFEFGEQQ